MRRLAVLVTLTAMLAFAPGAGAQPAGDKPPNEVALSGLPREAQDTLKLIRNGGPFPYERDGVRFGNRERLLPAKPRDYYHEYTVKTPGAKNRGARRIVCGGPAKAPDICYYTADHYRSFARIRE